MKTLRVVIACSCLILSSAIDPARSSSTCAVPVHSWFRVMDRDGAVVRRRPTQDVIAGQKRQARFL